MLPHEGVKCKFNDVDEQHKPSKVCPKSRFCSHSTCCGQALLPLPHVGLYHVTSSPALTQRNLL